MNEMIFEKIIKLRELINEQNDLYFQKETDNEITDPLFEQLLAELTLLENQYPEYDDINSPTHIVGGKHENSFSSVEHKIPMLSLGKVMSWTEFEAWFRDMVLNKKVKFFVFELKFDGLAVSLLYDNGKLVRGATRGDGKIGDDITATILTIPNIPKTIDNKNLLEIRGEVVLLKNGLDVINKTMGKNYKNVRNAASGILRTKNPSKEVGQYLRFSPYLFDSDEVKFDSYSESMSEIKKLGFIFEQNTLPELKFNIDDYNNVDDALKYIKENYFNYIEQLRCTLDFDIDGIVIKSNLCIDQQRLGSKTNVPNWAIAYKFEAQEKITILEDVEWLLGGKGNITPRSKITPVEIGGTTVTKPTLHNIEELKRLDIKIGDHIVVSRRGDVIPKIERVIKELRTGNEKDINIPTICPECGGPITQNGIFIRCDNVECSGRQSFRIQNYINAVEIEDFGPKVVDRLIEAGKIEVLTDIYNLKVDDIAGLERMGEKSATKIINNIEKSKNTSLSKIISGLTIKNVGITAGKDLEKKYKTLDAFSKAKINELIEIEGMGEIIASNIIQWLNNESNIETIDNLLKLGIGQNIKIEENKLSSRLLNKNFGFTGELSISRKKMEKIITDNCGIVFGIKKGIDYLVVGEGAKDEKIEKAKKLNAKIITEDEFMNLIK